MTKTIAAALVVAASMLVLPAPHSPAKPSSSLSLVVVSASLSMRWHQRRGALVRRSSHVRRVDDGETGRS